MDSSLQPRHAGHHHIVNIKYGYVVLALSALQLVAGWAVFSAFQRSWRSSGVPPSRWAAVANVPVWAQITLWSVIIATMGVYKVEELSENWPTVIKRYGRVAYALLPLNIVLVLRPTAVAAAPWGYYLRQLPLHKWLSRLIFVCAAVHSFGYLYKWVVEGTLAKAVQVWNLVGVIVFAAVAVVSVVSVRWLRRRAYRVFYVAHNVMAWLFVAGITLHARPGVLPLAAVCAVVLAVLAYQRFAAYAVLASDIEVVQNIALSSLQLVRIRQPPSWPQHLPASHVRVSYPSAAYYAWLAPSHPYTVSSLADDNSGVLELIVRKTAHMKFNPVAPRYVVTGPYPSLSPAFFSTATSVAIVCGGSGLSFGVPLLRHFRANSVPVSLTWCVRSKYDLHVLQHLMGIDGIAVYVTGADAPVFKIDDEDNHGLLERSNGDFEMSQLPSADVPYTLGRPVLSEVLALSTAADGHWVVSCGPDSLNSAARAWAASHQARFFGEEYQM